MQISVEVDDSHWTETSNRFLAELWRPSLAEAVDDLAHAAVRSLQEASVDVFREPRAFLTHAFARTFADPSDPDPSAVVYVQEDRVGYYELEVFGGVRENVPVPARDAPVDSYGEFEPGYLDEKASDQNATWIVAGPYNDTFLVEHGDDGRTRFLAIVLPEIDHDVTFPFWDLVDHSVRHTIDMLPDLVTVRQ